MSIAKKLIEVARRLEPSDGFFGPNQFVDALRANKAEMRVFEQIAATANPEELDCLQDDSDEANEIGWIVAGAVDELDFWPDDTRVFKSDDELALILDNEVIGELRSACIMNDTHAVAVLCKRVDVNTLDHNGQLALSYATGNNHAECMKILLHCGADPNVVQRWGNTVLHDCATTVGPRSRLQLLIDAGGDLTIKNEEGKTPIEAMPPSRRREWGF